jgi:hypothetical protein
MAAVAGLCHRFPTKTTCSMHFTSGNGSTGQICRKAASFNRRYHSKPPGQESVWTVVEARATGGRYHAYRVPRVRLYADIARAHMGCR